MRILKLCYEFPPVGGGASHVVQGLSRELVELGHEVDLVTMSYGDLPRYERVDGVDVHRVPGVRRHQYVCSRSEALLHVVRARAVARRLVEERNHDLDHTHFILPDGVNARWLHQRFSLPYIVTAHGSDVPGYDAHRLRLAHRLLAPLWRAVTRQAEAVVCPSSYLRSLIHRQLPELPIDVIPNGIEVSGLDPRRRRAKRILIATRMLRRKGIQHVVEAMRGLELDHELHIVGDGPFLPELRSLVQETGVPARLWGWLEHDSSKLAELFETSSIFVLPSEAENFPISLLEAMNAGMAIVTSSNAGCAEVVGDAALLVQPGDVAGIRSALVRLTREPARCRALGIEAQKRLAERFSWAAVARQYDALYARLVPRPGLRGAA